jgi:predicted nucleic acid-binding protein
MNVERVLLDTNVLVYARDRNEPRKGAFAQQLLQSVFAAGRPMLSTQILSEFFWAVTRKIPLPLALDEAVAETRRLIALTSVVPLTSALIDEALEAVSSHGIPLWDAQILAAASIHGASIVLSEDFQHRQKIRGVTFLNPFADDFDPLEVLPS